MIDDDSGRRDATVHGGSGPPPRRPRWVALALVLLGLIAAFAYVMLRTGRPIDPAGPLAAPVTDAAVPLDVPVAAPPADPGAQRVAHRVVLARGEPLRVGLPEPPAGAREANALLLLLDADDVLQARARLDLARLAPGTGVALRPAGGWRTGTYRVRVLGADGAELLDRRVEIQVEADER